jgi:hypothetical protein
VGGRAVRSRAARAPLPGRVHRTLPLSQGACVCVCVSVRACECARVFITSLGLCALVCGSHNGRDDDSCELESARTTTVRRLSPTGGTHARDRVTPVCSCPDTTSERQQRCHLHNGPTRSPGPPRPVTSAGGAGMRPYTVGYGGTNAVPFQAPARNRRSSVTPSASMRMNWFEALEAVCDNSQRDSVST